MHLFYSTASPYVRKVSICAIELGLVERIERHPAKVSPTERNGDVAAKNPLGKLPTLVTDDGIALFDSRVICEYLDSLSESASLFPHGALRWQALVEQAAADGLLDAGLLVRYEAGRPEGHRYGAWSDGQHGKILGTLDMLEREAGHFGNRVDIGTISVACALGWLDFRFADLGWRATRPNLGSWFDKFAQRPAMASTAPNA